MTYRYMVLLVVLTFILLPYQNCSQGYRSANPSLSSTEGTKRAEVIGDNFIDDNNFNDDSKERGPITVPSSKIRALNGEEYANSLKTLTGSEIQSNVDFSDSSSGFKTGSELTLDKNILSIYLVEAERQSKFYLENRAGQEFSCVSSLDRDCSHKVILGFAEKAYRRPLSSIETNELKNMFDSILEFNLGVEFSLEQVLAKILVSPQFLYRTEVGAGGVENVVELTSFEKASFISYSLTGYPPDDQLYELAKSGKLDQNLFEQSLRLIESENGKKWMNQYFRSWLKLDSLEQMIIDPTQFPKISNVEVAKSLNSEFDSFTSDLVFEQSADLIQLMTTDQVFVNQLTAPFYGLVASGNSMTKKSAPDRKGLLTLSSVLSSHASNGNSEVDSPVHRGALIKKNLFCENVGIPSGLNLETALKNIFNDHPEFDDYTVRHQYEVVMQQGQSCISCHSTFMPYGYLFSNFNGFGEFKTVQKGKTINAKDTAFIDGVAKTYTNALDFIPELAQSSKFHRCFSQNMGTFFMGSKNEIVDGNLQWVFYDHLRSANLTIKDMIVKSFSDEKLYLRRRAL